MSKEEDQKYICFRFDVDTHRCLREGVPNLLEVSRKTKAPFTFFVNTGRSIDLPLQIKKRYFSQTKDDDVADFLPARRKLGTREFFRAAILNPESIGFAKKQLIELGQSDSEVGLHGGRNHETWFERAQDNWDDETIQNEVEYGLENLRLCGIEPMGFASPGWRTPKGLGKILKSIGFHYYSDRHGEGEDDQFVRNEELPNLNVCMAAEPGGVAWIENQVARGLDADQVLSGFRHSLKKPGKYKVMYDHPYFAGIEAKAIMESLVREAQVQGYRVVTLFDMLEVAGR